MTLIENINPTRSATSSCLCNAGKLGTTKATEKKRSRDPEEIYTTSLATTVYKKVIMMGTMTTQIKPVSKNMQSYSEKFSRRNPPTNPLVKDTRKHW